MTKCLFVGWEGCIIAECEDSQVGAGDLRLAPDVVPSLLRFSAAGFRIVPTTNRAGVTSAQARANTQADTFVLELLRSQGVRIDDLRVCPHEPAADCDCRKPGVGLVADLLPELDRAGSRVIDVAPRGSQFARNLGVEFIRLDTAATQHAWPAAAHDALDRPRRAHVQRKTRETDITVCVDLDAAAEPVADTGIAFFDHMLEQLGKHGGFRLEVQCTGDLHVDEHHTIEDVALAIGAALRQALGDKRGIERYGFVLPMDEAKAEVAIDLGGRAYLVFDAAFPRDEVGGMPTELVEHFFRSFSDALGASLHVKVAGENTHHMIEACFKGLARTLRTAIRRAGDDLPSTKGVL
jgi:imidazoleglycerol-phosphate dehydratase/histidinol-phosphatase